MGLELRESIARSRDGKKFSLTRREWKGNVTGDRDPDGDAHL